MISLDVDTYLNTMKRKLISISILILSVWLVMAMMNSPTDIRISCWDARGYRASIPYIRKLLSRCEILAISEHWVYENRLKCLADISDTHSCFARASKISAAEDYGNGRGHGGVALFWDKRLKGVSVVSNIILDRACAIRLQTIDGTVFYFISV